MKITKSLNLSCLTAILQAMKGLSQTTDEFAIRLWKCNTQVIANGLKKYIFYFYFFTGFPL